jgi:hypothetical protein
MIKKTYVGWHYKPNGKWIKMYFLCRKTILIRLFVLYISDFTDNTIQGVYSANAVNTNRKGTKRLCPNHDRFRSSEIGLSRDGGYL